MDPNQITHSLYIPRETNIIHMQFLSHLYDTNISHTLYEHILSLIHMQKQTRHQTSNFPKLPLEILQQEKHKNKKLIKKNPACLHTLGQRKQHTYRWFQNHRHRHPKVHQMFMFVIDYTKYRKVPFFTVDHNGCALIQGWHPLKCAV